MIKLTKMAAAILMTTSSLVAFAASPATASFTVTATVAGQGSLSATTANFGTINPGDTNIAATGGSFSMGVNSTIQPTMTFTPVNNPAAPYMALAGAPGTHLNYSLYLPTGGTNAPNVYAAPISGGGTCAVAGAGNAVINYGAPYNIGAANVITPNGTAYSVCAQILAVPAAQPAGVYTDSVNLAMNY